jgi:hypothetical protein
MDDAADVQTVECTSSGSLDPEWVQMEIIMKKSALLLTRTYPNHLWQVGCAPGGVLCIKHGMADSRFGYTIDLPSCHSSSQLEHAIIMGGGELLERMGMARGAWNGEGGMTEYAGQQELLRPVGGS